MTQKTIAAITSGLLAIALCAIALLFLYIHFICNGDGRESFRDKYEWSILQSFEARFSSNDITGPEFTSYKEYELVCLPSVTGQRVWIMLNPQSPPYYKQIPHSNYVVTKDQFDLITRKGRPISTVQECLASHMLQPK